MTVEELKDKIHHLKGSITKISLNSESNLPIGTYEEGYFKVLEDLNGGAYVSCHSLHSWIRTSLVQSIKEDGNNIMLTTQTSVYKIVIDEQSE